MQDFEDRHVAVLSGEARFSGARHVRNLVAGHSNDLTNASWIKGSGGTGSIPVVTANYAIAPDGTQTASRVQFDRGAGTANGDYSAISNSANALTSVNYGATSAYFKSNTGASQTLAIYGSIGVGGAANLMTITTE